VEGAVPGGGPHTPFRRKVVMGIRVSAVGRAPGGAVRQRGRRGAPALREGREVRGWCPDRSPAGWDVSAAGPWPEMAGTGFVGSIHSAVGASLI